MIARPFVRASTPCQRSTRRDDHRLDGRLRQRPAAALMRWALALTSVVILASLLAGAIRARSAVRLITVAYDDWQQLQQLDAAGLRIIHYRGDLLAALGEDSQVEALRRAGFSVEVVDPHADQGPYYLAYPLPGSEASALAAVEAAYAYGPDDYIVGATTAQADSLPAQGLDVVELPPSVVLPSAERAPSWARMTSAHSSAIQAMVDAVSPALLIDHVCKLQDSDVLTYCNELGTRWSYSQAGLSEAAQYLVAHYAALGLAVSYDPFVYDGTPMANVVAELPGVGRYSDRVFILCAHYDSLSGDPERAAPGADDNASGSAAVLEAARILSQHRFLYTLRFVHFAGEEQSMRGSAHYAAQAFLRGDVIDGVINLDMIGYETVPPGDHIVEVHAGDSPASNALADALIESMATYGLQLAPQKITIGATWRSDHGSFWTYGYPAILGIEDFQDFNPHYHTTDDTLANMRTSLMVEYTKATVATLAGLATLAEQPPPTPMPLHLYLPIIVSAGP